MTITTDLSATLTAAERHLLDLTCDGWQAVTERRSDREFDLVVSGERQYVGTGEPFTCGFSAWLPLATIGAVMARNADFGARAFAMAGVPGGDDWSIVRDAPVDAVWAIFDLARSL